MHNSSSAGTGVPSTDGAYPPADAVHLVDVNHPRSIARRWATLVTSFEHAIAGFWYVVKTQMNMRIHLSVAAAVVALGLYLGLEWTQWAVLGLTMGFVVVAEMFNTVAEAALDAATPYYHPLVKVAKDVAAGAVLVTAIVSVGVGLLVMGPPLWARVADWLGW